VVHDRAHAAAIGELLADPPHVFRLRLIDLEPAAAWNLHAAVAETPATSAHAAIEPAGKAAVRLLA
jgi:hypothetical protein